MRWSEEGYVIDAYAGAELLGYVAVDTSVEGRSTGGLRMVPDAPREEVRDLARSMTLKFGMLGLPQGGAKGCVLGDPEAPAAERAARLEAFARSIAPILVARVYQPDVDMGTDVDDVARVLAAAGGDAGLRRLRAHRSGADTARTVRAAARAAMRHLGEDLRGRAVAVEGFGSVGGALAGMLAADGARIVAVSTSRGAVRDDAGLDVGRLRTLARERGSAFVEDVAGERLEPDALLELPVDILCPCARWRAIHAGNVERVRARAIAPGANAPLAADAERALVDRGVIVVPDFVSNGGGVLGGTMAFAGVREAAIRHVLTERWETWVRSLLEESRRRGTAPRAVAEPYALDRHAAARAAVEEPGPGGRLFATGIELHRRGWVPSAIVGRLAERWFDARTSPPW